MRLSNTLGLGYESVLHMTPGRVHRFGVARLVKCTRCFVCNVQAAVDVSDGRLWRREWPRRLRSPHWDIELNPRTGAARRLPLPAC